MEAALKRYLSCDTITVESIVVEPANKAGAGYGSQMSRWDVFKTEALVLAEVMPTAHEDLQQVEGASFRPLAATCLHHGATPRVFLVLDDLVVAGYRLADADRPLDYQHCEVVLRAYSRLHAARPTRSCMFSALADFVKRVPNYEHYAAKYLGLADTLLPLMRKALKKKVQDTKLKVLVHGDCWKNNIMFMYSSREVADERFVDFQLTHVSSPARDLVYFLYANAGVDAHERLPSLLETYHSQLQASLRALGMAAAADAYPLDELLRDVEDLKHFALYNSSCSGFTLSSHRVGDKFSQAVRDLNFQPGTCYGMYDNEYSGPYMQYVIRRFESKGLL
ncbi:uncharacterized protein LOC126235029 [Schistocerca nitens]|uniref:uncharacterized protein LOC126235029 n=1 Tax=Schistocerca nitens TaxID=7011 RepID=UPI0021190E1E|nr:uncharacterized protein LOC126235029 [Schistocerca nitens]